MGCSLDTYRARIGNFGGTSSSKRKIRKRNGKKGKDNVSVLILGLLYLSLCIYILATAPMPPSPSIPQEYIRPSPNQGKEQYQVSSIYPYRISSRKLNKVVHIKNGNQTNRGKQISICYWNKGSAYLENRKADIGQIIHKYRPMVLGLGEAQVRKNHDLA